MSIVKAVIDSTRGTFADQYKEIVNCNDMGMNILVRKGTVVRNTFGFNRGTNNVITDGSGIIINEGQCVIIVENGEIIDFCDEPGKYIYNNDVAPSMLTSGLERFSKTLSTINQRIKTGGQADNDQRVYYVNTKELMGNKFGVGRVPFRDGEFDFTIKISAYGKYSYRITDPVAFFTNVIGNIDNEFNRSKIDGQLKAEVQSRLQPALGRISRLKVSYDQLPLLTEEIAEELNKELMNDWVTKRGISIESFAISSVTPDNESAKFIEEFQASRVYTNANMLGARLGTAQASAMVNASNNSSGAMNAFMGMNMAKNAGPSIDINELLISEQPDKNKKSQSGKDSWECNCGNINEGKFCSECGNKKIDVIKEWECSCGNINEGKFCSECGNKKIDVVKEWECICGNINEGKFCSKCGEPRS